MVKKDGAIVVNTPHPMKNYSFILPKLFKQSTQKNLGGGDKDG
jgi:hypothetical protein